MSRKFERFKPLLSDIHLHTAAMNRTPVVAFQDAELVGTGIIDQITEDSVKLTNVRRTEFFLRSSCAFYTVKR